MPAARIWLFSFLRGDINSGMICICELFFFFLANLLKYPIYPDQK